MIPLGATVRWAGKYQKNSPVIGVVTGHPQPRMVEVDGKGAISEGLLEVVGEMASLDLPEVYVALDALRVELSAAVAERDALRDLVVAQGTTIAELGQEADDLREDRDKFKERSEDYADQIERLEGLEGFAANAASYVEDLLLVFMGERRPVRRIEPDELRRLAEFVFEGA